MSTHINIKYAKYNKCDFTILHNYTYYFLLRVYIGTLYEVYPLMIIRISCWPGWNCVNTIMVNTLGYGRMHLYIKCTTTDISVTYAHG